MRFLSRLSAKFFKILYKCGVKGIVWVVFVVFFQIFSSGLVYCYQVEVLDGQGPNKYAES